MTLRLIASVAGIALAVASAACRGSAGRPAARPNILLVTIDTLRADHLGSYGYAAAETPALDALARRGVRFSRAMTVTPLTLPAHASLLTGTFPGAHGIRDNGGAALAEDQTTLAEALRGRGYRTGGFIAAFVLDHRWGLNQGFDRYSDPFDLANYTPDVGLDAVQRRGGEVVDEALAWMNEETTRPFFAWVHLYEPHAPYDAPERIRARFPSTVIGAYDAEVAAADEQVGRLVNALSRGGRLDRTIVAVLGDHGEALGEHQEQEHGFFLYDATVRIPLILAGPGMAAREVLEQVRIVDVMPTLLELAGADVPASVQGQSLAHLARGNGQSLVALSETWYPREHFGWSELAAIHDGRYTLIAAPRRELYDTRTDPGELHNLADTEPGRADALERALRDLVGKTSARKPAAPGRPVDAQTAERLRALGYVSGRVTRSSGDGQVLADPKDKIGVYNLLKRAGDASVQGRLDEAIVTVRKAIGSDPAIVEAYTLLGGFLRKAKRDAEAVEAFQRALTLDPHSAKSAWHLGEIWMARREYAKAVGVLEPAVADAVDRPVFLTKLAECYLYLAKARLDGGDLAAAEAAARKGLSLQPDARIAPLGHYVLADVYNRLGRLQDSAREAATGRRLERR